ncbi:MAG: hypothetical protein NTZ44_01300 [Candidatus Nomurabacteria bacterium]|nr:hypothetical protein [Candidatus Nomurabacteria bacterium]
MKKIMFTLGVMAALLFTQECVGQSINTNRKGLLRMVNGHYPNYSAKDIAGFIENNNSEPFNVSASEVKSKMAKYWDIPETSVVSELRGLIARPFDASKDHAQNSCADISTQTIGFTSKQVVTGDIVYVTPVTDELRLRKPCGNILHDTDLHQKRAKSKTGGEEKNNRNQEGNGLTDNNYKAMYEALKEEQNQKQYKNQAPNSQRKNQPVLMDYGQRVAAASPDGMYHNSGADPDPDYFSPNLEKAIWDQERGFWYYDNLTYGNRNYFPQVGLSAGFILEAGIVISGPSYWNYNYLQQYPFVPYTNNQSNCGGGNHHNGSDGGDNRHYGRRN